MAKRQGESQKKGPAKKYKVVTGFVDPNTSGIYATCVRGKEPQCRQELMSILEEKIGEYFDLDAECDSDNEQEEQGKRAEVSIEDQVQQELQAMKDAKISKKEFLMPIDLGCICLVFIKTRKPILPDVLVHRLCQESLDSNVKTTRYTQKLTPIVDSCSASKEELVKLTKKVLAPHFHNAEDQKPIKYAIQVSRRNFSAIPKDTIIKTIAEHVGRDHGHVVDLKNYDKLIVVECYKSNIGMSVIDDYLKLERYNLQQIYEKHSASLSETRVNVSEKHGVTKGLEPTNEEVSATEKQGMADESQVETHEAEKSIGK